MVGMLGNMSSGSGGGSGSTESEKKVLEGDEEKDQRIIGGAGLKTLAGLSGRDSNRGRGRGSGSGSGSGSENEGEDWGHGWGEGRRGAADEHDGEIEENESMRLLVGEDDRDDRDDPNERPN